MNGDELIAAGELISGLNAPYPLATTLLTAAPPTDKSAQPDLLFLVLVPGQPHATWIAPILTRYDRNADGKLSAAEIGWDSEQFAALNKNKGGLLGAAELVNWLRQPPDCEAEVRFTATGLPNLRLVRPGNIAQPDDGAAAFAALGQVVFRARPSRLLEQCAHHRQTILSQFRELDMDRNGMVSAEEIRKANAPFFETLLALADRDSSGTLSAAELNAFLDLQEAVVASHIQLSILDHGPGLFEALDTDRDGCLSLSKLRTAAEKLRPRDAKPDFLLSPTQLPRQWSVVLSRGQPLLPGFGAQAVPRTTGPAWFRQMDVNGDGVVSRAEFLGSKEQFDRLDLNRDGLIALAEAEAASQSSRTPLHNAGPESP